MGSSRRKCGAAAVGAVRAIQANVDAEVHAVVIVVGAAGGAMATNFGEDRELVRRMLHVTLAELDGEFLELTLGEG